MKRSDPMKYIVYEYPTKNSAGGPLSLSNGMTELFINKAKAIDICHWCNSTFTSKHFDVREIDNNA